MPLFEIKWNIATEEVLFKGTCIVFADDDAHAIDRCREHLGPEGQAAQMSSKPAGSTVYEMKRNEVATEYAPNAPIPPSGNHSLYAFEIAARANVVASSEKVAFARFSRAVQDRQSDGRYCTFLRTAVLEKTEMSSLSRSDRHLLSKQFQRVSGGGVSPR